MILRRGAIHRALFLYMMDQGAMNRAPTIIAEWIA
jgi:hypothetical protein